MTAPDWSAGLALLAAMSRTGRVFTMNDPQMRDRLRNLGFGRYTTGRLLQLAEADGLIRQVGVERSTDPRTRGAFVRRWQGVPNPQPVKRERRVVQPSLFGAAS